MVDIAGQSVPLSVNWHRQARRLTLRLDPRTGGARVTVPLDADINDAIAFLRRHQKWLERECAKALRPVPFLAGATIPVRGVDHEIRISPEKGRRLWLEDSATTGDNEESRPILWVAGSPDMVAIRTTGYLKAQARADLEMSTRVHAERLRLTFHRITIRDQRTRWGSCSSTGTLSFSWRLVMAPPHVLDYVAAHEVAHLKEMNHSPRFWRLVNQAVPDVELARTWLAQNGRSLHCYGVTADGRNIHSDGGLQPGSRLVD